MRVQSTFSVSSLIATKSRRRREVRNTHKLPTDEPLRREIRDVFREQRNAILLYLQTVKVETKSNEESQHPRDEHGRWTSSGAGHKFGKSTAKIIRAKSETSPEIEDLVAGQLLGDHPHPDGAYHSIPSVVGATDDSEVLIHTDTGFDPVIEVHTKHPKYRTVRTIAKDDKYRTYIEAKEFDVAKSERGKGNYGPQVFGRMVEQAAEAGVSYIKTTASRSDTDIGYYVWPRFGYDAKLHGSEKRKLPASLQGSERISDLMKTDEGRAWWKEHGNTRAMKFDLSPGSRSRKVWEAYLEEKKNQTSPTKTWTLSIERGRNLEKKDQEAKLPWHWPTWEEFRLGALAISERMTPMLWATWDRAASRWAPRVGLDPNEWSVINPHTERMIQQQAYSFCDSTNESTSQELDKALDQLKEELTEGIVEEGEALPALTKRVNKVFDKLEKKQARTIAQTETSRAVHSAQVEAAKASGVVTGWTWLASADACEEICLAIVARCPTVKLGQPFAVIGKNPAYMNIYHPPGHPRCNCSVTEVLITDPQPTFHPTLDQPEPATDAEVDKINESEMDKVNDVVRTWDPATGEYGSPLPEKPKKSRTRLAVKSKPLPKKRKKSEPEE